MPAEILALKPTNFLSVTKLTTPATASEPQEAEAPPVTTSTRWIKSWGNSLMSGTPVTLAGTKRSPSIRVRVRMVPRPNRLKDTRPLGPPLVPLTLADWPVDPISEGSWVMALKILSLAWFWMKSWLMTVVGVGALKPAVMMREDDTVTDSIDGAGSWA